MYVRSHSNEPRLENILLFAYVPIAEKQEGLSLELRLYVMRISKILLDSTDAQADLSFSRPNRHSGGFFPRKSALRYRLSILEFCQVLQKILVAYVRGLFEFCYIYNIRHLIYMKFDVNNL